MPLDDSTFLNPGTSKTVATLLTDDNTLTAIKSKYIAALEKTYGTAYASTYPARTGSLEQGLRQALNSQRGTCQLVTDLLQTEVVLDCSSSPAPVEEKPFWQFVQDRNFILAEVAVDLADQRTATISISWQEDDHVCEPMGGCSTPCPTDSRQETDGLLFMTLDVFAERVRGTGGAEWKISLDEKPCVLLAGRD